MLENFEEYTEDITPAQKQIALMFSQKIQHHVGKQRAVKSKQIEKHYNVNGTTVRKMANYLRTTGLCPKLVSTSKGYFIAANNEEMESYLRSMYDRGRKIMGVAMAQCKHLGVEPSKLTIKPVK